MLPTAYADDDDDDDGDKWVVEHVINSTQMRYQSAELVGLQMASEHRAGESCRSQGGW